jgi:hypothetical protein
MLGGILFMNKRRIAALQAGLLFVTVFANAASKIAITMRIKVLSSESQTVVLDDSGVPKNCDGLNFDAYCHSSQAAQVTNTLLVQEEDGAPFRVACAVDSRWSRCTLLPQGESFDARKEKHGITVYYQDDNGKLRKQSYALVAPDAKANPVAGSGRGGRAPHSAANREMQFYLDSRRSRSHRRRPLRRQHAFSPCVRRRQSRRGGIDAGLCPMEAGFGGVLRIGTDSQRNSAESAVGSRLEILGVDDEL